MQWMRGKLNTPARQATAWAVLGVGGVLLAAIGTYLLLRDGGEGSSAASRVREEKTATVRAASATAAAGTATPRVGGTPTPSTTPTPSPTGTPTPTETPTATPAPQQAAGGRGNQNAQPAQPAAPEPTATPSPTVAARQYCPPGGGPQTPPNALFGLLKIGGVDAPVGTLVTLAFDGAPGPSAATVAAGGYRFLFVTGGTECSNRPGAAISVIVNGQSFATRQLVGPEVIRFDINAE